MLHQRGEKARVAYADVMDGEDYIFQRIAHSTLRFRGAAALGVSALRNGMLDGEKHQNYCSGVASASIKLDERQSVRACCRCASAWRR